MGRRLVATFALVTAAAIALVSAAGLLGSAAGLRAQHEDAVTAATERALAVAGAVRGRDGAWTAANAAEIAAVADGAGARLVLRDADGSVVFSSAGQGLTTGRGRGALGHDVVTRVRTVTVDGRAAGSLTLAFESATAGRPVAWGAIAAAAFVALVLALAAGWATTRWLTRPLARLTATAQAWAEGDRDARTGLHLDGELGALAAAFDEAATRVADGENARRALAADVAHEMRTPLAVLQAGLEELRDGLVPADAPALARLHDQALRLGRVVGDLADLSAADAARLSLDRRDVDLAAVVAEALAVHEPRMRAAGLILRSHLQPAPARVDEGRIHQVVANLLQNCTRHCHEGDTVTVSVQPAGPPSASRPAGMVRLVVSDTGPGIPPEFRELAFSRFWKAGEGAGSGLGLAIVRSLVLAHGGTVTLTSPADSGTQVCVDLPAANSRAVLHESRDVAEITDH